MHKLVAATHSAPCPIHHSQPDQICRRQSLMRTMHDTIGKAKLTTYPNDHTKNNVGKKCFFLEIHLWL